MCKCNVCICVYMGMNYKQSQNYIVLMIKGNISSFLFSFQAELISGFGRNWGVLDNFWLDNPVLIYVNDRKLFFCRILMHVEGSQVKPY